MTDVEYHEARRRHRRSRMFWTAYDAVDADLRDECYLFGLVVHGEFLDGGAALGNPWRQEMAQRIQRLSEYRGALRRAATGTRLARA